jgi:hypothetical protein
MFKKLSIGLLLLAMSICQVVANCNYCDGHDCLEAREDIPKGKGASGKWIDDQTPKRDWTCIEVFDREGEGTEKCQMCEREDVRYAHVMKHGDLQLEVGCVCAAYMDGTLDEEASKDRESALRARPGKLVNFMNEDNWKLSKKGDLYYTFKKSTHNPNTRKVILSKSKFDDKYAYSLLSLDNGEIVGSYRSGYLASKKIAMKDAFNSLFPIRMPVVD